MSRGILARGRFTADKFETSSTTTVVVVGIKWSTTTTVVVGIERVTTTTVVVGIKWVKIGIIEVCQDKVSVAIVSQSELLVIMAAWS